MEIGGDFFLTKGDIFPDSHNSTLNSLFPGILLSTCRSAISEILKEIEFTVFSKVALVPSFTCHVCVEPFVKSGYNVIPYPVEKDLSIDWEKMLSVIDTYQPSILLVHSYFGLNTIKGHGPFIEIIRNKGVLVIEDETQVMFSSFPHLNADFFIGSIRKWFPIPDGAFLHGINKISQHFNQDKELEACKLQGMLMKGEFLKSPNNSNKAYRLEQVKAEQFLDSREKTYGISDFSIKFLGSINWSSFKASRKRNYDKLYEIISSQKGIQCVLPRSEDGDVPFMFPVFVDEGRKELQQFLVKNKIYPTIIWACPDDLLEKVDSTAKYIYDHILCFHCDQRYDLDDMERIGSVIKEYYR